jgi:predicted ATP-binding protein involved in virulence
VVLIDEPELHLHPQWHDDVIRKLWELAPWNQYIIATHSERIARSVERDRLRILR